jgi:hypothetical protein
MSLQEVIYRGSAVSTGAPQFISVPAGFDQFVLRNLTTLAGGAGIIESKWWLGMAGATAETKTLAGGAIADAIITAGGFTYYDSAVTAIGPAIALTVISQAAGAVVSTATTPPVGSIVRLYSTTQMLQVSGYDFSVTAVTPGVSMTLGYLDSSAFAAAANAGFYRLLPFDSRFVPPNRFITAITQAAQAVVTLSVTHHYSVGNKVKFDVSAAYGMSEINGLVGTILAVSAANNTITVDIDTTGFTAFAFPLSAAYALGVTPAQIVPSGEIASVLTGAIRDSGTRGVLVGAALQGTSGDVFEYWAYRSES